jgi:GNAT superfamily N-acetyltransferase
MSFQRKQGGGYVGGDWRNAAATAGANAGSADRSKSIRSLRKEYDAKQAELPQRPIAIRPMCIDDAAYVLDSWANSYRRSPTTGPIEREVFNIEQRARINRLVSRPHSRVFVACDAEDTHQIRGWVCFEAPQSDDGIPVMHYVCVQPAFQMQGIGTALVALCRATAKDSEAPMWATHETQPMRHIREKWNLLYNPYLLEVGAKT